VNTLPASEAWQPLPASAWDAAAARHLLRRATWSAQPSEVARALADGLPATLARLFPERPVAFPKPKLIERLEEDTPAFAQKLRDASPEQRRLLQREARDRMIQALQDMSLKWLPFAAEPAHAAQEKWTLFLGDIYVVGFPKVRHAAHLHAHHASVRRHAFGPAPELTRAMSRSPAMIHYLDLQDSRRDAPNENFARELFELFVLGEGHYTETDIKEAARAFTGHRERFGEFVFVKRQHDAVPKTVFGITRDFDGDGLIELAYRQPAAATFLPHELARFYLTDAPLPAESLATLGAWWRENDFELRALALRFFGSRQFFDPSCRGNFIKSPVQFYLALVQDLQLDVAPLARQVLGSLRQMGQTLFSPPNVRGWVGGRQWVNSATLGARRQLLQALFHPIDDTKLNGDELIELTAARAEGRAHFTVEPAWLNSFASAEADKIATRFLETFIPGAPDPTHHAALAALLRDDAEKSPPLARLRTALIALLQSPDYQLC
jgi:uncharacterized protein (DUF1800 family)